MYKTLTKAFLIILFASAAMLFLIPFISRQLTYITVFSFLGYCGITLLSIKFIGNKLSTRAILLVIIATILVLQSFTIYTWFVWDTFGLPVVVGNFLGVISIFFIFKFKWPFNFVPMALSVCFVAFMFFRGFDYWLYRVNYGSFTGAVNAHSLPAKFEAYDEDGKLLGTEDFHNKIVLLDFWFTSCTVCFEKFPQLQATYDNVKNDPNVLILAVDKPFEEDKPKQAFEMIKAGGYTFPVVIAKDADFPKNFGVTGYPTTFVINRDGMIVFKGDIDGAAKVVNRLSSH